MTPIRFVVDRVVSGGQTGVDRAALDVAIELGIEHGGWCPRGRLAEDGPIAARYQLRETDSPDYPQRTEQNVLDSDGTLIVYRERLTGGTKLTEMLTRRHSKPLLLVDLATEPDVTAMQSWLRGQAIRTLNVAGPRESTSPGIAREAAALLRDLLCEHWSESSDDPVQ
ncbi:MAG: putative molybdenum carrier protein [Planctomycetales bacterium]|nr:putative molybdenum carrier protein [Planctomycetales bacterium]